MTPGRISCLFHIKISLNWQIKTSHLLTIKTILFNKNDHLTGELHCTVRTTKYMVFIKPNIKRPNNMLPVKLLPPFDWSEFSVFSTLDLKRHTDGLCALKGTQNWNRSKQQMLVDWIVYIISRPMNISNARPLWASVCLQMFAIPI